MMKIKGLPMVLVAAAFVFTPLGASAQSTYTTTNGEVNLVAGLTNLTSATAINTTNQSVGIQYLTDDSWSGTGVLNLGVEGIVDAATNNGTLAGDFGGGTYFAGANGIILIGYWDSNFDPTTSQWGPYTVRLLLSDDSYSAPISFSPGDASLNPSVQTAANWSAFNNGSGENFNLTDTPVPTVYQELDIAAFDPENIGFKGIELSNMELGPSPAGTIDLNYIGVTSAVPEPSTYALLALSAAVVGAHVLRRRRK